MAGPYSTGPAHLYVGVGSTLTTREIPNDQSASPIVEVVRAVGKNAQYLGTCERGPVILIKPEWKGIFTNQSGHVPEDIIFMGEHAFIIAEVNRWNEPVYRAISSRPFYWGVRGKSYASANGTLMVREQQSYPLWVVFPYAVKPVFGALVGGLLPVTFVPAIGGVFAGAIGQSAKMPGGYRFAETLLEGPDRLDPLGTKARKIGLVWHAIPERLKTGRRERVLYDHDMSGVLNVKPN